MVELTGVEPEEILREDALPDYAAGIAYFRRELWQLNMTIYFLDQILTFPFELFRVPGADWFFPVTVRNFLDAGLLAVTRLATDRGSRNYTLPRFMKWLRKNVKPQYSAAFMKGCGRRNSTKRPGRCLQVPRRFATSVAPRVGGRGSRCS